MYSVLIIGAGKFGAFYDCPSDSYVLTHAHAFFRHRNFRISGFVDCDLKKAKLAASVWGGKGYQSIEEVVYSGILIDVVVICTPDTAHYQCLQDVTALKPRLVCVEKPPVMNSVELCKIKRVYEALSFPVFVNYTRRYVREFIDLKRDVEEGRFGALIGGVGYYSKGTLHSASHLLDVFFMLGIQVQNVISYDKQKDYTPQDPSITAMIHFKHKGNTSGYFLLQNIPAYYFFMFELDLCFEKGRIRILDEGNVIERYNVQEDGYYSGYSVLKRESVVSTSLKKGFSLLVDNVFAFLTGKHYLICTLDDVVDTFHVCDLLVSDVEKGEEIAPRQQTGNSIGCN